ncbi:MAG: hypothetical protein KKB51_04065 [Candidatus Riflebacteria bacterium]|nr:hypothetical protein [Candidatus Riflebacteria bacterium]
MKSIGFDFGSVYTKGILIEEGRPTGLMFCQKKTDAEQAAVETFLAEIESSFPGEQFRVGITGINSDELNNNGFVPVNAILATALGVRSLGFSGRSVVEIGGQNAKLITFDVLNSGNINEFAMNDVCASGSGAFIEQQARRLQLELDEFSRLSGGAAKHVPIAGRCAVFAKTDMIHLQQKGFLVDELALGVCMAICSNFSAMLLKGRELETPAMIAGGCARNAGVVRAFSETFKLHKPDQLVVSPLPAMEGSIGAALSAEKAGGEVFTCRQILKKLAEMIEPEVATAAALLPLKLSQVSLELPEPENSFNEFIEAYLGVDVGSVSTDMAIISRDGEIISSVYLPTRGRPLDALREGLEIIKQRFHGGLKVLACATTGSGRHLAGRLLGADLVKNEITCQFLGVRNFIDDVDTIFEIGGQDSKYISLHDGSVSDFVMNKVCAAGTGSFLEEQAQGMGIDIKSDFSQRAFSGNAPIDLGSHCTVFMETEVCSALQKGVDVSNICAGLACSIARNYLEKVVGNRPVGKRIAFQGGVASNKAVVAAFEQILQRPVQVSPFNRITGAIGAAIAAKDLMADQKSTFRGLDCVHDLVFSTFKCSDCANNCEVGVIEQCGSKIHFGDTCERYTSQGVNQAAKSPLPPNLAAEYMAECECYFGSDPGAKKVIGLPRASTIMGYLPFWGTFFREIGWNPVLSEHTTSDIFGLGLKGLPVSVCLPAKLMAGHIALLKKQQFDYVFVPSVMNLPQQTPVNSYACPYAMAMPFMINDKDSARVLSPVIAMTDENAFSEGFYSSLRELDTSLVAVKKAYCVAVAEQQKFYERFRNRAAELRAHGDYRFVFGVAGKPYNVFDPYLNLGLFERLRKLGVLAIPTEILPLSTQEIECALPWGFSANIFRAVTAMVAVDNIYPLMISNYGCALDAFTFKQLEPSLKHHPHLILEFDEQRGEAGLLTRIEAFIDQLESARKLRLKVQEKRPFMSSVSLVPKAGAHICMPYWSDHVYAFAGLWECHGYQVEILPVPDQDIRLLGERFSLGKECSPYAMIVGDLLQLHEREKDQPLIYHFPSVTFPCLLNQYGNSLQVLVEELGIRNIQVSSLTGTELAKAFGVNSMQRLYEGLMTIDVLVKAACEIRPYEKESGMTGKIYAQCLQMVRKAMVSGDLMQAVDRSLRALATVPVDRSHPRPLVGIAGDLYTKVNEVANNNLFKWLEKQGLEVWPSPSQIDLLDCSISSGFLNSLAKLEIEGILVAGTVAFKAIMSAWRVRKAAGSRIKRFREPNYLQMMNLAKPYMSNEKYELLLVNIAKIVDFVDRGADGVINAICFNCMVGNASTAIIEKIRQNHTETPIITAVYSGGENSGRQIQLEAFVGQVKERYSRSYNNSSRF